MEVENYISLLGGVALFLFGMSVMGDSLKKVAGSKMEMILYKLSGNTLKGVLLGTGVTAVIQSSSATSVMVVGFVNSGMMKVRQAIGVVLGAILGTSITGWILCLNNLGGAGADFAQYLSTEILTGVVALAGIVLWMFAKKNSARNVGGIMLGFSVLMYGMSMMSASIAPLKEDERFLSLLTNFSNPILGILIGIAVTAVIQSASASVGILQALAMTGAIEFDMAFPILMGIGIGASVPVMLSALGASTNGIRTAFVYLVIDVLGAILCGSIFYGCNAIFGFRIMTMTMTMVTVALTNTLYRLAVVVLLSPCIGMLERIVCRLFPEGKEAAEERADMDRLESRFLNHPALAIEQSREVISSMAKKAGESVEEAVAVRRSLDREGIRKIFELEAMLDRYEDKLGVYLFKVTSHELNDLQTREVNEYLRVLSDLERISDHAKNIGEAADEIQQKHIRFSKHAEKELQVLENAVLEIVGTALHSFMNHDLQEAMLVEPLEEVIDDLCDEAKARHIARVGKLECTLGNGFVYNDLLTDYERISDHCSNVAEAVLDSGSEEILSHEYHQSLKNMQSKVFWDAIERYREKYAI